jgi:hypothetical protein
MSPAAKTVVRTYDRGSVLGFLSVAVSWLMARRGMRGWQASAAREMEDDAVAMSRRGDRVASSEELGYPGLGITWYRVTYQLIEPPAA